MVFTQKVSANMTDFIINKLPYDLTSNAGLALVVTDRRIGSIP